jgi:murein DD-endopeptidase MepM/ murein hydrolase activator NlpD
VRNSLRLFGLLAVLAGVNVYVFFFNRGTAPREVLRPSSMVKTADGKAGVLRQAVAEANTALDPQAAAGLTPVATQTKGRKPAPPVAIAPAFPAKQGTKISPKAASSPDASSGPPKGSPGGSPGQDDAAPLIQANNQADISESRLEKKIGDSDTLGQLLAGEGFDAEGPRVVAALSRLFDPKLIRGGQTYTVRLDEQGEPDSFEYRPNGVTRFVINRGETGSWIAVRVDQPVEIKTAAVSGIIDSTLYESVQAAGEGSALAGLLVELLAWDVNFYTDTHPGDHWKVMVEKQFLGGQFYRYGRILGAEYGGRVGTFRAFYWKPSGSSADAHSAEGRYFDERGQAVSKTMLKTPLRYVRVSSKFDRHRFHPILHQERAHLGIDYAAPKGTPVWASSAGKVITCEKKPGSGNTVILAHANGVTTRYYHLSRFARGLKAGKLVRQKEVIGFVGSTGLATGPHLHFSVTKNGAFVDPSKVQVNRGPPVTERASYLAMVKPRLAILQALEPGTLARN